MHVIRGLDALAAADDRTAGERSAVLVGVFDGVHLGHQRLLHELLELAAELDSTPTVVTFENHPDQVLHGRPPEWLTSFPHRMRLLRRAGVQRVLALRFDDRVRNMDARTFAVDVLTTGLHTNGLLLGYDSAFGKNREGTPTRFRELGAELGFDVREAQPLLVDGEPISSSAIRAAIGAGELARARRLLGRWPSALGEVVHGDARGRELGFPTANVVPECRVLPPSGVYAVEAILDGDVLPGVANLGVRPTFTARGDGGSRDEAADDAPRLEVHLFDFDADLYGRTLEVCFVARLRGEQRFANATELETQIAADVAAARRALAT